MIGGGIAQRVEKSPAATCMTPAFSIHTLGVGAHVQKFRPGVIVELRGLKRARQMRLTTVGEFDAGRLPQYGQSMSSIGAASEPRPRLWPRRSSSRRGRTRVNGALIGCGWSRAMVQAKTWAEPGVALNPPVPQPQLPYRPGTSVLAMMGDRSGVTSTMPPQLRIMRSRRKLGNNSQMASRVCVLTCKAPRWVYEV